MACGIVEWVMAEPGGEGYGSHLITYLEGSRKRAVCGSRPAHADRVAALLDSLTDFRTWYLDFFGFEGMYSAFWGEPRVPVNIGVCPGFEREVLEETETYRVYRQAGGTIVRQFRNTEGSLISTQFLEHPTKSRDDWKRSRDERFDPDAPDLIHEMMDHLADFSVEILHRALDQAEVDLRCLGRICASSQAPCSLQRCSGNSCCPTLGE